MTELAAIAPVHAVHGNTDALDLRRLYAETIEVVVAERRIRVVHGHLLGAPTPANLRTRYPDADVIVYGHTHKPLLDVAVPMVVNPGAAGPARFNLRPSVAILALPELKVTFCDL